MDMHMQLTWVGDANCAVDEEDARCDDVIVAHLVPPRMPSGIKLRVRASEAFF